MEAMCCTAGASAILVLPAAATLPRVAAKAAGSAYAARAARVRRPAGSAGRHARVRPDREPRAPRAHQHCTQRVRTRPRAPLRAP